MREIKEGKNVSLNDLAFPMPNIISSEINKHQKQNRCLFTVRRCGSTMDLGSIDGVVGVLSRSFAGFFGAFNSNEKSVTLSSESKWKKKIMNPEQNQLLRG